MLNGPDVRDQQGISAYFVQMGQFIDHDITLSPEIEEAVCVNFNIWQLLSKLFKIRNVATKIAEMENIGCFQLPMQGQMCVHRFRYELMLILVSSSTQDVFFRFLPMIQSGSGGGHVTLWQGVCVTIIRK